MRASLVILLAVVAVHVLTGVFWVGGAFVLASYLRLTERGWFRLSRTVTGCVFSHADTTSQFVTIQIACVRLAASIAQRCGTCLDSTFQASRYARLVVLFVRVAFKAVDCSS